jgi:hypothetical protein
LVNQEIAALTAEQAETKARIEATTAKLSNAVDSMGAAAILLSKHLAAVKEARDKEAALATSPSTTGADKVPSWPATHVFGPKFVIPEGEADPKLHPFEQDADAQQELANVYTYEPWR